ncbi:hypothetical protein PSD17_62320 [Pseudonocardia sp. D17]|nr:hypothetical protein PSD17_62320 [Pseudonocardia sp. D17]
MALSGRIGGRRIDDERSSHWFPKEVVEQYLVDLKAGGSPKLPRLTIEAYFCALPHLADYQGSNNSRREDRPGVSLICEFDPSFEAQYAQFIGDGQEIHSLPVEFYRIVRRTFAGDGVIGSRVGVQCAVIDSTALRLQSGADYYLRKTLDEHLSDEVRSGMALALRAYRENLSKDPAFIEANESIAVERNTLHKKSVRLAADASPKSAWESGIVPHLDDVPFGYVGKGEQAAFKTLLALDRETARGVVLIEEPENHLSFGSLNALIERITERTTTKQLVLTTHSSFVLNKLGIRHLKLLKSRQVQNFATLSDETQDYFLKLAGYDTLRLVLARATILVEGPSDELIVQKAYRQKYGRMPLADGIDVMSVQALAFRRFLELGRELSAHIAVVTDLDDDASDSKARKRFEEFEVDGVVKGFVGEVAHGRTLEPQLVHAAGGRALAEVLGVSFSTNEALSEYMTAQKTDAALKIFNSDCTITMPKYIEDAIDFVK